MPRICDLAISATADPNTIVVTATGPFGTNSETLPVSAAAFYNGMRIWNGGGFVQDAFPDLTAAQCEFLMTGTNAAQQERLFRDEDGDE